MSNHFHLLINFNIQNQEAEESGNYVQLHEVMKRIKGASASYANKALNRTGQFWEHESYGIYIRNEKMYKDVISYILENPVKARIVKDWNEHPFTYLKIISEDIDLSLTNIASH